MSAAREGLGGSDAEESAKEEAREQKESRSRHKAITETRDRAAMVRAETGIGETIAEQTRLSLGVADATVEAQYERFNKLSDKYVAALEKIGELQQELADEKSKDRETARFVEKKKLKKAKHKQEEKTKRELYASIERQVTPMLGALTPHLPVIASKLLPIGLDFAIADGDTPRDAMKRLLKRLFTTDEKDQDGSSAMFLIQSIAKENGPNDWIMIQAYLVTMASQMSDLPVLSLVKKEEEEPQH